jgi:hypothetical protein
VLTECGTLGSLSSGSPSPLTKMTKQEDAVRRGVPVARRQLDDLLRLAEQDDGDETIKDEEKDDAFDEKCNSSPIEREEFARRCAIFGTFAALFAGRNYLKINIKIFNLNIFIKNINKIYTK